MEMDASQPFDSTTISFPCSSSSPPPLRPSDQCDFRREDFPVSFASLCYSNFPPNSYLPTSLSLSPSPSSSASSVSADFTTEHRLHQARLILECQELSEHHDLCVARLQALAVELHSLRQENLDLRVANTELLKLLSLSSRAAICAHLHHADQTPDLSPQHRVEPSRFERRSVHRNSLPKSISVRSKGHLKVNQQGQGNGGTSRSSCRQQVVNQLSSKSVQQRVCMGKGSDEEELEMEVYNQGMMKTELCNKWEETGTCPYGKDCQFAHGIKELRPVIRHPRYKTAVCRMVLAGGACPYGHRCHFRHSLSEQERLVIPR